MVHTILILTTSGSHNTWILFYLATVGSPVNQKIKTIGRVLWKVLAEYKLSEFKLYVTHRLVVCSDYVNRLGKNMNTTCITKNTKLYLVASKNVDLYVSDEKATKRMVISRQGDVEQNHNTKIDNKSFENVAG
jgi:hypothetical protein